MTGQALLTMDNQTLQMLAEATARAAATEIASEVRTELAEQFATAKAELKADLQEALKADLAGYFGEMRPATHIVQHDRLSRAFSSIDKVTEKFWGRVLMNLIYMGLIAGVIFWIVSNKFIPSH